VILFSSLCASILLVMTCGKSRVTITIPDPCDRPLSNTLPTSLTDHISLSGQNSFTSSSAINSSGTAVVVWNQNDTGGIVRRVYAGIYSNGTWTAPTVDTDSLSIGGQGANNPVVGINDNGYILVAWVQSDGVQTQIFKSEYYDGSWHNPSGLADNISFGSTVSNPPALAVNSSGDAIIVWTQSDGGTTRTYKAQRINGTWSVPTAFADHLSANLTNATQSAVVAMNDSGDATVAWTGVEGANNQIYVAQYRSGVWTIPSGDADNLSPNGQNAILPAVAMNNSGEALVAWFQSNGSNTMIFKSEYYGGSWHNPASLADSVSVTGRSVAGAIPPVVKMSQTGESFLAWAQNDGTNDQLFIAEKRNGAWSLPTTLASNISPDGTAASIGAGAMNAAGGTLIFWNQADGNAITQGFLSQYRLGAWSHPTSLSDSFTMTTSAVLVGSAAINSSCKSIVTWRQSDGSRFQIFIGRRE
jgi:hypothetical protein